MRFCVLASGSGGNCVWAEHGGAAILVDNGLPLSDFRRRASSRGLDAGRLIAVLLTHEHGDHMNGVGPVCLKYGVRVHTSRRTLAAGKSKGPLAGVPFSEFGPWGTAEMGPFTVSSFPAPHDTEDPQVFVLRAGGSALGVATDMGMLADCILENFKGLTGAVIEFNHDQAMLRDGPYPNFLKARVKGPNGHLSNDQGAEFLAKVNHPGLKCVVLGHLSAKNNDPKLALAAAKKALAGGPGKPLLAVADQHAPTKVFDI
ncbi:MAG: MBL fold metallo-hydrolase [Deltaproteobacteria bacterium]|jgi:phosphoribosyl 1,2-cyclic phosphodiesterase|nr:MBL fold metallo-hydrolase [Deltaproteobacteria bacterium]